jgi:hypothetical protein
MALSIVPILLSLLASLAPATSMSSDLVVRVVDKDGKPVAGVQVGLCPVWPGHSSTFGIGLSDASGNARIENALDTVRRDTSHAFFVRLGMPADPDVRASLDREHLDDAHPTLVVPDHGRVVLKLPAIADESCHARLRCRPRTPAEQSAIWSGSSLPQIRCEKCVAACEFVGIGLDLEYEVLGKSLPQPLRGTLRGPSKSGEVVTFEVPDFESAPALLARLVGEDLKPLTEMRLQWTLGWHTTRGNRTFFGSNGGEIVTDEEGRIAIPLSNEQARQSSRDLELASIRDGTRTDRNATIRARIGIPDDFREKTRDLGELVLASFGSLVRFHALDDKALEERFLTMGDTHVRDFPEEGDPHVEIVCEMVRRGGAEFERFLTESVERIQRPDARLLWGSADELTLRTALARIRHEPDPLQIVVEPRSRLEVPFPSAPQLECSLKNCQTGTWDMQMAENGGPHVCGFEVIDSAGTRLRAEAQGEGPGGLYSEGVFPPGASMLLPVDFGRAVSLPRVGDYRVRMYYSWNESLDSLSSMQGRIVASSREFVVRVTPCTIRLTQARLDELRATLRKLDTKKTLPLVNWHWRSTLTFNGEAVDPEDVLFRAGREALPALFEALEDPKLEPEHRAWVFTMLWNILGGNDPSQAQWLGVIGPSSWSDAWPTSSEASTSFGHTERLGFGKIDPAKQAEFTKLWLETKANYELKIVP